MAVSSKESKANIQALRNAGVPENMITNYGNKLNPNERDRILNAWKAQQAQLDQQRMAELDARTPEVLKNDPSFKSLPADLREIAIYNYEVQKTNDKQKADNLAKALEMATAQADPYWKSMLLIAQDEVLRSFEEAQGDFESTLQRQQRIMQNINQDLTTNKDFLTLEQQSDLANLKRGYEMGQERIIEGAANQGLTFSTKRQIAQQRLAEENQGLVESTNRAYNKQITDLQTAAGRNTEEAQKEIEDLERRMGSYVTSLGRGAETYLGSERVADLPGYQPLGNVVGTIEEEKIRDIELRKNALYSELTASSLNF